MTYRFFLFLFWLSSRVHHCYSFVRAPPFVIRSNCSHPCEVVLNNIHLNTQTSLPVEFVTSSRCVRTTLGFSSWNLFLLILSFSLWATSVVLIAATDNFSRYRTVGQRPEINSTLSPNHQLSKTSHFVCFEVCEPCEYSKCFELFRFLFQVRLWLKYSRRDTAQQAAIVERSSFFCLRAKFLPILSKMFISRPQPPPCRSRFFKFVPVVRPSSAFLSENETGVVFHTSLSELRLVAAATRRTELSDPVHNSSTDPSR